MAEAEASCPSTLAPRLALRAGPRSSGLPGRDVTLPRTSSV